MVRFPKNCLFIFLPLLFTLFTCVNHDEDAGPDLASEKTIGPAGGVIETVEGVVLTIPEGALDDNTFIKITRVDPGAITVAEPDGAPYAGDIFSFEPHGLEFKKPVHIVLPLSSAANTVLRLQDPTDEHWQLHPAIDFTKDAASFETTSFSMYAPGGPAGSGASPDGPFWSAVTVSAPHCIPVVGAPGVELCGKKVVRRLEIVEESTTEIIGACSFGEGNRGVTSWGAGYEFWCERIEGEGSTEIKIHAEQANLPLVHVYWFATDSTAPSGILHQEYIRVSAVNGPDGQSYADPYQEAKFKFGGFKELHFTSKDKGYDFMQENAVNPLKNAGYDARMFRFTSDASGSLAIVDVYDTQDARVLIEKNVLEKKNWKIKNVPQGTWGNKGTYEYTPPLTIGAMPIFVTDIPILSEKPVSGMITITRASEGVTDATVTLNGITIPHWSEGLYDVEAADVPAIAPGSAVTITASTTDPEDSRSITFYCPPSLQFTAPDPGTIVTSSQPLNVSWSPAIPYDHAMRIAGGAIVGIYACYTKQEGNEMSGLGHGADFITLTAGQTSQSFDVDACRRYMLELQYPGDRVIKIEDDGAIHIGYVSQRRRMLLQGTE